MGKMIAIAGVVMWCAGAAAQMRVPVPARSTPPARPGLTLSSRAFIDGGIVPDRYSKAATAPDFSPELAWAYVPEGVASFALIVHDPDTSIDRTTRAKLQWLIFNIPGTTRELFEGMAAKARLPDGSVQGLNEEGRAGYMGLGAAAVGPFHHYIFELYALDAKLPLGPEATESDVMRAMQGHVLMKGVLVGRFHLP